MAGLGISSQKNGWERVDLWSGSLYWHEQGLLGNSTTVDLGMHTGFASATDQNPDLEKLPPYLFVTSLESPSRTLERLDRAQTRRH